MAEAILRTKLFAPRLRAEFVDRPVLVDRLRVGEGGKLSLITGPAGFGKTSLASSWVAKTDRPWAWLSLDERDNDVVQFLAYVSAAVEQMEGVGATAQSLLESEPSASHTALATALLNDCTSAERPFVLVLDDYHVISQAAIHEVVAFLLDNLPHQVHLAVTSRTEPLLPLSRLRAAGHITEIRAADLRFTQVESAAFLERMTGYALTDEQVAAVHRRVEGWPAGLQMVALSIQGVRQQSDVSDLIDAFAASRRYIFDYLVDEVLDQRSAETQTFLLQTSLLDRLSLSLCRAVTGQATSADVLHDLEHKNLFLFPLDENRLWFRYHHLFAELLRRRLHRAHPDLVPELHVRASRWFEDNNHPEDAIHHALEGGHHDRAAQLCEVFGTRSLGQSNLHQAKRWLKMLPAEQISRRPRLGILSVWVLILTNELDQVEAHIREAQNRIEEARASSRITEEWSLADPVSDLGRIEGEIATCQAVLARANGDVNEMIVHLNRALSVLPEDAIAQRGTALLYLGFAEWMDGDGESALASFETAIEAGQTAGRPYTVVSAATASGRLHLERGALRRAEACFRTALRSAERHAERTNVVPPVVAEAHTGLAKLAYERGDTETARSTLEQAIRQLQPLGVTEDWVDANLMMARILWNGGDRSKAHELMAAVASAVETADAAPILRSRVRTKSLEFLVREHASGQRSETDGEGWDSDDDWNERLPITYLQEEQLLVLARRMVNEGEHGDAIELLNRLDDVTRAAGRIDRLIRVLLVKALARKAKGDVDEALTAVAEAMDLGERGGYLRVFLDESDWLADLLPLLPRTSYRDHVSARLDRRDSNPPPTAGGNVSASTRSGSDLSGRELEVLRLLSTHLSGPEIAGELYVSTNTLKTHTRSIYRKLGVGKRRDAVAVARRVGLI